MSVFGFFFINFIVSFLSDIILNDLANDRGYNFDVSKIITSLKPYFEKKLIVESGFYAAITIIIALGITSLITNLLISVVYPRNNNELLKYSMIAFVVGYVVDILIDKLRIFGDTLDDYYRIAGAGLWGAIAFVFSIIISYLLQKNIVPYL